MLRAHLSNILVVSALLASALGCRTNSVAEKREAQAQIGRPSPAVTHQMPNQAAGRAQATNSVPAPYPPGAWRKAPFSDLDETMMWLSHILILHRDVSEPQVAFNVAGWLSSQPPATRTREQALLLADHLADEARAKGNFEALARQASEDPATRDRGGSLGGVRLGHFSTWPQVLDALSAMKPGDISRAVETDYGFHILQRRPPPPELTVSGSHIVIAHNQAPWIRFAARGTVPGRDREQARALARKVYEEARANPAGFASLVQRYSEHRDAARDGDFGSWFTHELTGFPLEIETLSHLAVGEVAEPIDTTFGYQIILRTPNRPRAEYAIAKIQLPFDSSLPEDDEYSKPKSQQRAKTLSTLLVEDPTQFSAVRAKHCCDAVWRLVEGRELPGLLEDVSQLKAGEILGQPLEDTVEYIIAKRLDAKDLPKRAATRFELP